LANFGERADELKANVQHPVMARRLQHALSNQSMLHSYIDRVDENQINKYNTIQQDAAIYFYAKVVVVVVAVVGMLMVELLKVVPVFN
jgi:hypothetical protein